MKDGAPVLVELAHAIAGLARLNRAVMLQDIHYLVGDHHDSGTS